MTMTMTIGRRGLLGSLATAGMLQATLPWDLALAQGTPAPISASA
ncbi:hypothetical protein ACFQU2_01965 [Siccirubricoccus deserti]